jgi:preprotein translocase subunit SecE
MAQKKTKTAKPAKTAKARPQPARTKAAPAGQAGGKGQASLWERSVQFLREVKTELKKVAWPNKRQTISSTGVVLVLVGIVSVFLGLVDMVLARLVRLVIG